MKNYINLLLMSVLIILWMHSMHAQENVVLTKNVDHYDWRTDREGVLTLEAYAPGRTIITEQNVPAPCDIVLVLDVSSSMNENLTVGTLSSLGDLDTNLGKTEGYYTFFYIYPIRYHNGNWQYDPILSSWTNIIGSKYEKEIVGQNVQVTKINALKTAVKNFITQVQTNADTGHVSHNISIVKYAGDYQSSNHLSAGNHSGKTEPVQNFLLLEPDSTNHSSSLKNAVELLNAGGVTSSDYGMTIAGEVLNQTDYVSNGHSKVVIMFTDGEPNRNNNILWSNTSFDTTIANSTISIAKNMKTDNVKIFTVGLFENTPANNTATYMDYVSSKYPQADGMSYGGDSSSFTYSLTASSMEELNNIFEVIATQTVTGSSMLNNLDSTSVVKDLIEQHLRLPDNVQPNDIHVYTANYNAASSQFDTVKTAFNAMVSIPEHKTVKVTGFDFSKHWCGIGANNGQKLIIEIPITADEANDTRLLEGDNDYPTSLGTSGIYTANNELVALYPIPEVLMNKPINTPIKLIHFNAECMGNVIAFTWSTATETNNEYFTIERSEDAIHYTEIIRVKGAGTSACENSYNLVTDKNTDGMVYYRLRQTDINGTTEVFEPIALQCHNSYNTHINIYPVPANDALNIESNSMINSISIYGIQGKLVKETHVNNTFAHLNIQDMPSGVYIIKVYTEDGRMQTKRITKL